MHRYCLSMHAEVNKCTQCVIWNIYKGTNYVEVKEVGVVGLVFGQKGVNIFLL